MYDPKYMIPVSEPLIGKNASKYIEECLKTGWVSSAGSYVEKFEEAFAKFIGTKYAVATNSGTSALHLSLAVLDIQKGDEVILPSFTMIASLLPIIYQGAIPILVDVEKQTCNINPLLIEKKITKKTKAIMPVHMYGHPVNMEPIIELARKYNLAVIEDAAEAHGAECLVNKQWKKVGSIGDLGCFSFYGNKIITTGEGGMITTNNKHLAERAKSLRNLARTPGRHFLHQEIAFAYRMSNVQAAVGLAELEEIKKYIKRKIAIANLYQEQLGVISEICLPQQAPYAKSVFWQYGILLQTKRKTVAQLESYLKKHTIETRRYFTPMHRQPACIKRGLFKNENYPIGEQLEQLGLCLPSGVAISDKDLLFISQTVRRFFT